MSYLLYLITVLAQLFTTTVQAEYNYSSSIASEIDAIRAVKDSVFRYGSESPIHPNERTNFSGLNYYPFDPTYRFEADMHRYGRLRQIELPSTGNTTITIERYGRLYFRYAETEYWVEVYRSLDNGQFEVFFKDLSNGETTYEGGRHILLEIGLDGKYLIDFNNSYNPYCVYNYDFICPLPPPQNFLPFHIMAGEMKYGTDFAKPGEQ